MELETKTMDAANNREIKQAFDEFLRQQIGDSMSVTLVIQILEALANAAAQIVPLFEEGKAVLSETDANAVHAALTKAESATATLRPQVDAALAEAAGN